MEHDGNGVLVRLADISGGQMSDAGNYAVTALNGRNLVRFGPNNDGRDVAIHARVPVTLAAQIAALVNGYTTANR